MSRPEPLTRFTGGQRAVHHATAVLMLVCLGTAACLYVPDLSTLVGRRSLMRTVHIWCGFALPVPVLLGWLSRAFREDVRRLNRFEARDREWLRRADRRAVADGRGILPVGKFNAGQKLNAAFVAGSILVMLGTGTMLTFPDPWSDDWRTGATFVHDWLTIAVLAVVLGHLWYALRDPGAMGAMWHGRVGRDWAARHHAGWLDESGDALVKAPDPEPERSVKSGNPDSANP
ncbi:cytochrome b/b6 domain-containing protein [Thermomonospora umbrina]|uniref:Formate dehydrogenase subunit gamma n=1 Tax=Thermomonospora umbrina TaxID=111806 RepID=A0A3D9SM57_9ACTN|nr:cytochrome b/b6 domain-containing protein [Thermomonospora umbrina]REE95490.1 formate dehydrogenase subunit gamma [Thermomonospora umbrina]